MEIVFDMEANGLLDSVTECHCVCASYIDSPLRNKPHWVGEEVVSSFLGTLEEKARRGWEITLIGHNIIKYDLAVFEKLYGWELPSNIKVIDTLILSQLLQPDRKVPLGCKGGPHSLEAWGIRLGRIKVEHEDWSVYTPEMLHRCQEDVEINVLTYHKLLEEMGS